jgi:uncharacterized protein (TIGR02246 family)
MSPTQPGHGIAPALTRIMETYRRAWETRDAELILDIFSEDATYQENPFSEPLVGHEGIRRYWEQATGNHRDIRFRWRPAYSGESLHVLEWQAEFARTDSGRHVELRGVMLVELRGERIFRFREYWHRRENN